ncbi:MAG: DrmE family protein [Chitinophagaceae bacterium]
MPTAKEEFFVRLWREGKIYYEDAGSSVDELDEISSKLACSALDKKILTLFILPDSKIHRGALIFGTILIKYAVKSITEHTPKRKILYFGTTLRFKHAIESTYVGNLSLSKAFTYIQASGKYDSFQDGKKELIPSAFLPEVICIYNPTNPDEFVNKYRPDTIVIDCGKEYEIEWLQALLKVCKKRNVAAIGWGQNCFSKVTTAFESNEGSVFYYPGNTSAFISKDLASLYLDNKQHTITPILFSGSEVTKIDADIYDAKNVLRSLGKSIIGQLKQDALRLCWKLVRLVETITVPIGIYNAEAKTFWHTYSFEDYIKSIKGYIELIKKSDHNYSMLMSNFLNIVDALISKFHVTKPPYWIALSNFCLDRTEEGALRVFVFPSRSQKQLFSYAILADSNITEDELFSDSRVILRTFKEISNPTSDDSDLYLSNKIIPIVMGLPDLYNKDNFYEILPHSPQILLYPNQIGLLKMLIRDYNHLEKEHLKKSMKTLKRLSGRLDEVNPPAKIDRYLVETNMKYFEIGTSDNKSVESRNLSFTNISDLQSELSLLFENGDASDSSQVSNVDIAESRERTENAILVENAIELKLEDGYRLLVAANEQLNIIRSGKIESVYVRSISVGTNLLVIHNQTRQNLYDLIISRVHNHPSLIIHTGMLKKWKEEFYLSYLIWKDTNKGKGILQFLHLLQTKGSSITSALTVSNWLDGTTLRPLDELDIYRVGEVLNIKFVKDNYKRIYNAASRIVGIHITLSRKLNEWLNKKSFGSEKDDMEIIDKEIGLTFGELRSSINILKVENVLPYNQPIISNELGKLEKINS